MQEECVSLQLCVSVLGALESVVRRCVGPEGGSVLFTRDTGDILISKHGRRILTALNIEHPLARMVLDCMCAHTKSTGDGSKSFVLLLAALLRGIQESASMHHKTTLSDPALPNLANRLLAVGLKQLDDIITHKITPYAMLHCRHHSNKLDDRIVDLLVSCYISGRVGIGQADSLRRVLCEFYNTIQKDQITAEKISFIHSHFTFLHTTVTGRPIGCSEVIEGLVVPRDWSVWTELEGPLRALVLYESVGSLFDTGDLSISIQEDWFQRAESIVKQKLAQLLQLQVNVVLSSVKQPDIVLEWARMNCISLLECVESEQLDFFCHVSAIETLSHPGQQITKLKYCRRLQLGGHRCAHLGLFSHMHTLVLCAPAPGLLDQIVSVSQGVFAMLQHLSQSYTSNCHLGDQCQDLWSGVVRAGLVIPAGGVFELLLHYFLLNNSRCDSESGKILAKALLSVPRALYSLNHRRFLKIQTRFLDNLKLWEKTAAEESERPGLDLELCYGEGLSLESVCGKQQLVVSVLQCLHRLLCVGGILKTRSAVHAKIHSEEEDVADDEV